MTDSKTPDWADVAARALDVMPLEGPQLRSHRIASISQALLSAYERGRAEREWQPIETMPTEKDVLGRGLLITWADLSNTFEDGTWGPDQIEFTYGFVKEREGKFGWWNMNSGNISWYAMQPTHWAYPPAIRQLLEVKG